MIPLESDNKLSDESFDKYLKIVKKKKELINVPRISKNEMREILFSEINWKYYYMDKN